MATVIDALIVTLGLDATQFTKGQKQAAAAVLQTQQQMEGSAKKIEGAGRKAAEFFGTLRTQALALFGAFLLGRGIGEFVSAVSNADAHVGRMSRQLGISANTLTAWMNAAKNTGGSAEGMKGAISNLVGEFQRFGLTGESTIIPLLRSMGISLNGIVDKNGQLTDFQELMFRLADAFSKMPGPRAMTMGQMLGFDEGTINLLMKGRKAVAEILQETERFGNVNKENTQIAEGLVAAWNKLVQASESLGRAILNKIAPALEFVLDLATRFFNAMRLALGGDTKGEMAERAGIGDRLRRLFGGGSSAATPEKGASFADRFSAASDSGSLRLKPGAMTGGVSAGTLALATSLQNEIPGLTRFTALNDDYHKGFRSKHNQGLAFDFTLNDPSKAAAVASQIRAKLAAMGIDDAKVLDEYNNPSGHATGAHLHVQFNSRAAAERYANSVANHNSSATTIGTIVVNTQATDAAGVARDLKPAIERNSTANQANSGLQ